MLVGSRENVAAGISLLQWSVEHILLPVFFSQIEVAGFLAGLKITKLEPIFFLKEQYCS